MLHRRRRVRRRRGPPLGGPPGSRHAVHLGGNDHGQVVYERMAETIEDRTLDCRGLSAPCRLSRPARKSQTSGRDRSSRSSRPTAARYVYEWERDGRLIKEPVILQRVRALITEPQPDQPIEPGDLAIRGLAWSGGAPIARVDVSAGGGPLAAPSIRPDHHPRPCHRPRRPHPARAARVEPSRLWLERHSGCPYRAL